MTLTPDAANVMYDRHSFLIHGERKFVNPLDPWGASEGCIVIKSIEIRMRIGQDTDKRLKVVQ
jgi:hypothetical protein